MLRTTSTAAVRAFKPVQVSAIARRNYSDTFNKREKAAEDQYARQKEAEQIKQLKEALAKKEKEIEELKKSKK
ncbi:ATPase inhibitor, mitochondrial [Entomortierella parvispora]|uniref:ATPase inhibitor, mitochondrial n=1 Tax=Entomortierella parvispora TaxID=205924 RepID=A0A9P3H2B5_9FUNG|nr:ATPase inhibitor, mitochondrial [Entomortierella parvispora]